VDGGWGLFFKNKSDPILTADLVNDLMVFGILSEEEISSKIRH
jgi:hypothetical protein